MAKTGYEVLVDELTVHRGVKTLVDPVTKEIVGEQQGAGKTYYRGEIIPEDAVSSLTKEIVGDKDHPAHDSVIKKLKKVSKGEKVDLAIRLSLPFDGYDDLDEDEIIALFKASPSSLVQAIKSYETSNKNRSRIIDYSIGLQESPMDRQEGREGSDLVDEDDRDEDKVTERLTTREVDDDGEVTPGEGITGATASRPRTPGSTKGESTANSPAARRSRRKRTPGAKTSSTTNDGGSGSGDGSGDDGLVVE